MEKPIFSIIIKVLRYNFILLFLLIMCPANSFAQNGKCYPVDTSFTTYSAYQKEVKQYPFISIAKPVIQDNIIVKKDIEYVSYGNRAMHLDFYSPSPGVTKDKRSVVLLIHGGGWRSGNKEMQAPLATFLASNGFICASAEYRLSLEANFPAAVIDLKTAIRWLRKNAGIYGIDTTRIAALGCSSGGQLAALLAATNGSTEFLNEYYQGYSSDIQAVIDIDGILAFIHPESGEGNDIPGKPSAATQWFGCTMNENPALWNKASALSHIGRTFPPVLFINSQYPRFHAGRDDLIARLDSMGIYSEVHQLENTPHTFWLFNPWFEPTANWCLQFLTKQFNP